MLLAILLIPIALSEEVREVIDGDTFMIGSSRFKLIGVEAPEPTECYFIEAKERLETLLVGKRVTIEIDEQNTDRYDRLLRYAYVDGVFINEAMIRDGFARSKRFLPDVLHADILENAQREAKANSRGIWRCTKQETIEITMESPENSGVVAENLLNRTMKINSSVTIKKEILPTLIRFFGFPIRIA